MDFPASIHWGPKAASGYAINVCNRHAAVSRWEEGCLVAASNWRALEDEAAQVVEALGGAINMSGQYPCPVELADKARWDEAEV